MQIGRCARRSCHHRAAESPIHLRVFASSRLLALLGELSCSARFRGKPPRGRPTRRQGQFLAFIREYMMRNAAGLAPAFVDFERYFGITPPSVNSMLIRLEKRKFIRRILG